MARIKVKNSIKNAEQAREAMDELNAIDTDIADVALREAKALQRVKVRYAGFRENGKHAEKKSRKGVLQVELKAWAESDSSSWETKTYETPAGRLGFRLSTPAVKLIKKIAKSFKASVELLRGDNSGFIRTVEEVDKEAILAAARHDDFDEAALRKCGLQVDQEDEFWIETEAAKALEKALNKLRNL